MIRNDYRRALIMLRGLAKGYSGHVRLERRTLNGSMQFTVNGAFNDAPMQGVVLGEKRGEWFVAPLGQLSVDRRDQAGLLASFDPRNIQGRDLEEYALVGVVQPGDPQNPLVMSGYVNGSREVDWPRVREACNRLLGVDTPAAPVLSQPFPSEPVTALPEQAADASPLEPDPDSLAVFEQAPASPAPQQAAPQVVEFSVAPAPVAQPPTEGSALLSLPNPEQPWPESIQPLRSLFEHSPSYEPFAAPGYVFVRAPLPGAGEDGSCAIGVKTERNEFAVLCYAVPGTFALEPPPGLEGYSWRGTGSEGWWTTCIDLRTGEAYDGDDP